MTANTCEQRFICTECAEARYIRVHAEDRSERITIGCPECGGSTEHRPKGGVRWF